MNGTAAFPSRATAAMSSTISENDFTTPDRSTAKALSSATVTGSHPVKKKEDILTNGSCNTMKNNEPSATLVTPPDSFSTAAARKENAALAAAANSARMNTSVIGDDDKQVRFDNRNLDDRNDAGIEAKALCTVGSDEGDSSRTSSPSASQRGLVSRRGGRCGSPGRRNLPSPPSTGAQLSKEAADAAAAVLEFKTFRSPEDSATLKHERNENESDNGSNGILESLSSTNSVDPKQGVAGITSTTKGIPLVKHQQHVAQHYRLQEHATQNTGSITHERSTSGNGTNNLLVKRADVASKSSSGLLPKKSSSSACPSSKKNSNVTFSPVPMARMNGDKVRRLFGSIEY